MRCAHRFRVDDGSTESLLLWGVDRYKVAKSRETPRLFLDSFTVRLLISSEQNPCDGMEMMEMLFSIHAAERKCFSAG